MRVGSRFRSISLTIREFSAMFMREVVANSYSNGLNMRPQPFKVSIKPRSESIRKAIIREGEQALVDLAQYDGETKYRMSTFYKKP